MAPVRVVILVFCVFILGGAVYLSSLGIWGASASVSSIRAGSAGLGGFVGRVK